MYVSRIHTRSILTPEIIFHTHTYAALGRRCVGKKDGRSDGRINLLVDICNKKNACRKTQDTISFQQYVEAPFHDS